MAFNIKSYRGAFPPPPPPPALLRGDNGNKLLCYAKILKCFLTVITYVNTVRVVCDVMTTEISKAFFLQGMHVSIPVAARSKD